MRAQKILNLRICLLVMASILLTFCTQEIPKADDASDVFVDSSGVMRWQDDLSEVSLFGVNYTTPFAHAYRVHNYLGVSHEEAIEEDVYHFARLGFDAFRVHVWDCEISDTVGNLLENEHLRLFDFQLNKMKQRGMKIIITPIAYWGNGYPEPEEETPGFSTKYGKGNCLVDPGALAAQEIYLFQFMNHVNPYTDLAYKDDPDIIAIEISNEPHHGGTEQETTDFINRMVQAVRNTGFTKPVFYNVSHSTHLADAYARADIQGGTFQWYPTGLVRNREIRGNFLPNVNSYPIPFGENESYRKMARMVYEFDAADVGRSYIYPYIAKSYREAGMQFATHFAYDPLHMAWANTEYQTHYMNLAYAPQKALSLKIAAEVFHRVPRGRKTVNYPQDTEFDVFRVSYENDLAEMLSEEKFIYTNNTSSVPPDEGMLEHIAGYGSSPLVSYEGSGAYFLDQLEEGIWRLEVMPDAVWVRDPFERASLRKKVSVILWNTWTMEVELSDLGSGFAIRGINDGNQHRSMAEENRFMISPGTYLLIKDGKESGWKPKDRWENIILNEFVAPPASCEEIHVLHKPLEVATAGQALRIEVQVVAPAEPDSVSLLYFARRWRPDRIKMKKVPPYAYVAEIPADAVRDGNFSYYITLDSNADTYTWPAGTEGSVSDWDFYEREPYTTTIIPPGSPIVLFQAEPDGELVYGNSFFPLQPSQVPGETIIRMSTMNRFSDLQQSAAFKYYFRDKIAGRIADLQTIKTIKLLGYSDTGNNCDLQVGLQLRDGSVFGGTIKLGPEQDQYSLSISDLKQVDYLNLPTAYPGFMAKSLPADMKREFRISDIEVLQISMEPSSSEGSFEQAAAIKLIYLE